MHYNKSYTNWLFVFISILIIGAIIWNTYLFFVQLKDNERTKMEIWASAQSELEHSMTGEGSVVSETALNIIRSNQTTPMILHTLKEDVYVSRNMEDSFLNDPKEREAMIKKFSSEYSPIEVRYKDQLLSIIYFGNSPLINKLKYYPAALILIITLFFVAIYFFFKTAKSSEQNKLWAGMAKETAHQIGTPLSSLIGWTEILKAENVNPQYIKEMEKDVSRLEMITDRFSKIGSIPALVKTDLVKETSTAFDYLKTRTSKLIDFKLNVPSQPVYVNLNSQLFSWTIENIVKNGIDAMKGKGCIILTIERHNNQAFIKISDTGKGLSKRNFKRIFAPGFTTKKRGWGLGLSLAKRIIEEYHNGKLRVLKSSTEVGTTMEIILKITD